ncbi:O-antigen ligase family protein [Pseudofrancisella aestuarii]|uniref:O-antigen ligase family protein n=1 Tax=Pseudofrancisella aestuarii TaxID=2670347 RepID=A0ABV9TBD9_9GAMM|nr:O-antigen ligase family protein [Pseudofrancisella aestuarii]
MLYKNPIYIKHLITAFIFSSVILATFTMIMYFVLGYDGSYTYMTSHIVYTIKYIVAITCSISSIILINLFIKSKNKFFIFLAIYLIAIELCFNQSRTGYVLEFILISYYAFALIRRHNSFKTVILIVITFITIFSSIYTLSPPFKNGIDYAISDSIKFFKNTSDQASGSSGIRLSVYYVTIKIIENDPSFLIMGCGLKPVQKCVEEQTSKIKDMDESKTYMFTTTENQYIQGLYQYGLLGMIIVFTLLLSAFMQKKELPKTMSKSLALIIIGYSIVFIFNNWFEVPTLKEIFFFMITIIISSKYIKKVDKSNNLS